ncbi:MAG: hypothetical protein WBL02_00405 [Methanomethylovorans sp.]|uniref:DUF6951 family protein n=1 Tax=Methanomethylovorans sp. TaxID=2758717 RepID=UPI003C76FE68
MPSNVTVDSGICGFVHKVHGKLDGKSIIIDIETPCEKIRKMSHMEIPMKETMDIKDNYVMNKAKELQCTPTCLVPCAVLHVCWMESGMLSKSLACKIGDISIKFDE